MKKGSVLNPSGKTNNSAVKRKRSSNEAPVSIREEPAGLDLDAIGRKTRQPVLGGAPKDWELPNITSTELNIAPSWEAAMAASLKKEPKVDVPAEVGATEYDDNMSSIYTQSVATGFGSNAVSTSNATFISKSTVATGSTASMASMSYNSTQPMAVDPASKTESPSQAPAPPPLPPTNIVPKAALYTYFGKKPWRKQIGNDEYFHWNNGAKPHELKFTAIFQNPISGECFPSGRYGNPEYYVATTMQNQQGRNVEIIWYTKKTLAEHGAAARCYDCLMYRQALQESSEAVNAVTQIGTDPPYLPRNAPPMPPLPPDIENKINENAKRIQEMNKAASV